MIRESAQKRGGGVDGGFDFCPGKKVGGVAGRADRAEIAIDAERDGLTGLKCISEGEGEDPPIGRKSVADRNAARIRSDRKWSSRGALIEDQRSVGQIDDELVEPLATVSIERDREKSEAARAVVAGVSIGAYLHGGNAI